MENQPALRRRALLAGMATSVAIAGCSTGDSSSADNPSDPNGAENNSDNGDGTGQDNFAEDIWLPLEELPEYEEPTVVDFETAPLTAAVVGRFGTDGRIYADLDFVSPATPDAPATIEVALANRQPWEQTIRPRRLLVMDDPPSGRNPERESVYLAPTPDHPFAETVPETALVDGRWRVETVRDDWFPESITFEPKRGFVARYHLLGSHQADDPPIEPGRYRFTWRDNEFTIAVWETNEPGPPDESRFAGQDVPALPDEDQMRWFHEATAETKRFLRPDTEQVELPATIEFDLRNHSRETMGGNPHYWRVYKLVDEQWYPVEPWEWTQPYQSLQPGGRDTTELALFAGEPITCQGKRAVGHLGGGTYAFETGFSTGGETHAAMFDIEAPELVVEPEPEATIEETDDQIDVELPNHADARQPATITVTRTDEDPAGRLIPEQLPRRIYRPFRNALPLFDPGVETVQVWTDRSTALRPLGYDEDQQRVLEYQGERFAVSATLEDE